MTFPGFENIAKRSKEAREEAQQDNDTKEDT